MKELNKTNRLTIVVVAIVLVFVTGILTLRKPDLKYSLNPLQSLELLKDNANYISSDKAQTILAANDGQTIFIDVRNSIAFDKGHVKDAVNIPVRELFTKLNMEFINELEQSGQTALIYGETPRQANGPWMMLRQLGFNNIVVFDGTYHQLNPSAIDSIPGKLCLLNEVPVIDTAALKKLSAASLSAGAKTAEPAKPIKKTAQPVKVEPSTGGGC